MKALILFLCLGSFQAAYADGYADDYIDALVAQLNSDYQTAHRLLKPLAEQGHALAQFNLGGMYANGDVVLQDYIQAHAWFNLSASQGKDIAVDLYAGLTHFEGYLH